MMEAVKIKKHLDSEIVSFFVSREMIGRDAEIIVLTKSRLDDQTTVRTIRPRRKPGTAKGKIIIADDFEGPLDDEIAKEFYK